MEWRSSVSFRFIVVFRRTQEMGIRAALGAKPLGLVLLVLKDLLATIGAGLSAGVIGALSIMTVVPRFCLASGPPNRPSS